MNHIIRETSSEMRAIARQSLRGNWKSVAIVMALYYLLMITLPLAIDELIPGAVYHYYDELLEETLDLPIVSTLYSIFLTGPFELGVASFFLCYFRSKDTHPGHLFDGFEHFIKAVLLTIVIGCRIILWSILFIVPGIIAAFRYSQAYYILADHPELSIGECLRKSKEMMVGNKGKLFIFELSYIGWGILASLAAIPLTFMTLTGLPSVIADYVTAIPHFFYLVYIGVGRVVFYELAAGNLMARPSNPVEPQIVENTDIPKNEFDF